MGIFFKIVLVNYVLVFCTDAHQSTSGNDFDVDVFTETSDSKKMDRIMNGAIATHDMFPYLVSIQTSSIGQHFCGGALLTPYHVLTAAHCTFVKPGGKQFNPSELQIRIGPSNLHLTAEVVAKVKRIQIHEGYKKRPIDNDIAVLKVDKPLTTEEADIPRLSSSFISPSSAMGPCIAVGWGRLGPNPSSIASKSIFNTSIDSSSNISYSSINNQTLNETSSFINITSLGYNETYIPVSQNSSQSTNFTNIYNTSYPVFVTTSPAPANTSSVANETSYAHNQSDHAQDPTIYVSRELRFTLLPLQNVKECAKDYKTADITDEVLCAGKRNSKTDTCKGDSGGPLICDGKIEGIVSFGDGCENPEHLGVYTRVYKHLGWIKKQVNVGSVSHCQLNVIFVVLLVLVFWWI